MAITITVSDNENHTISSSKKILSRQGELGETITFSLPSTLNAAYPRAWIMVQQPDGQLYYVDNGSGAGFTWPNPYTFTYNIGDRDTMLSSDGTLGIQIVLRDATPPAQTVEWRSRILYLTIEGSILSNVDSGGSLIDSLSSGTLNRLADIQYDSLADGDLLYRDTTTGKWRNVTLVDGANISHVLNKTTGELTLQATGNISTLASDLVYTDAGGYYAGSDGETISQEIGASLALKAPLASPALTGTPTVPTAAVGTNTTQAASTAFVVAEIPNRVPQASETVAGKIEIATSAEAAAGTDTARAITPSGLRGGLNASGSAPIYACRAWLNFNGTGTPAFRGSRNISSITDNGTGDYTIVFTTPMPDENYVFVGCGVSEANTEVVMQKSGVHSAMQCGLAVLRPGAAYGDASMIQCAFFA